MSLLQLFKQFWAKPTPELTVEQKHRVERLVHSEDVHQKTSQFSGEMLNLDKEGAKVKTEAQKNKELIIRIIKRSPTYRLAVSTGRIKI